MSHKTKTTISNKTLKFDKVIRFNMKLSILKNKKPSQNFLWLGLIVSALIACSKDKSENECLTCTGEANMPFELCEDGEGNATVNGESTQTDYRVYLANLQKERVVCD